MKNSLRSILSVAAVSTILISCGKAVKDVQQRIEEPKLMQSWQGKCTSSDLLKLSVRPYYNFSGSDYKEIHAFYSDKNCEGPAEAVNITYKGELTLGEVVQTNLRKLDLRFDHVEVTAVNEEGKKVLENVGILDKGFCGVKAWQVGKAVLLDGKTGTASCPLRTVPAGEFNIAAFEGDILYLGKTGLKGGPTTEAKRPTDVDREMPFTKSEKKL